MFQFIKSLPNVALAAFIVRWILGVVFVMAGYWKVFIQTPAVHTEQYFTGLFADRWIPEWLLWVLGMGIPFLELIAGILLCIGLRVREAATALGLLLIVTTYGHALLEPLFDIDGHTFTRLALIVFLLMLPAGADRITLDHWLSRRGS